MDSPAPQNSVVSAEDDKSNQVNILDVEITNENVALNVLVTFVNVAQKRGVFSMNESAKIWECIQKFQRASR